MRRLLLWTAGVLVVLLLLASGFAVWTVRRSFPTVDGELTLAALDEPVEVIRDEWGVPHLYGSSLADLARAQGYVHAQDRFWEMDVRRHVTAGRLSELFGESQLDTDRFVRTLGWRRVAEQEVAILEPRTIAMLEAYAEGVNAYIDERGHTSSLSLEYAILGLQRSGYEPEPWTPVDSLAWLKAMAWDLRSNMEAEIERALLTATLPVERVEELYPPYPYDRHGTIVPGGGVEDGRFVPDAEVGAAAVGEVVPLEVVPQLRGLSAALDRLPALLAEPGEGIGSNSWVVGGDRTVSGMPLLANDPHLGPALPSIWYQMGLHCREVDDDCPLEVVGYTFSGVPGVVIGHNARIAWGFTNLGPDVTDLYLERLDGDRYEVDGEWRDVETITETIEVAGADPVEHVVRLTRHGPLLSDVSEDLTSILAEGDLPDTPPTDATDYGIALRWTALDPGRTADAILMLNTASDLDDFREAARRFEVPAQNLVYADVDGHIAYQAPGRIPIRPDGHRGRYPAPGWTTATDWQGFIPFEELPFEIDPADSVIVTANEAVAGPGYPHHLTDDWAYGYRGVRIRDLLDDLGNEITRDDLLAVQIDARNLNAEAIVPYLLAVDVDGVAADAQALLADWDLQQDRESAAGAYFQAVWRHLLALTFHDELPEDLRPGGNSRWFEVVRGLLEAPEATWWDDVATTATERRDVVLAAALTAAADELTERLGDDPDAWRWGALHTLALTHQTLGVSGVGPIERLFNRGPIETSGGSSIVNATGWEAAEGYEVTWVPSMRMVVDLSDLDTSRWINLTGQSGHAFHGNYTDMAERWRDGETIPMRFERRSVDAEAEAVLTLVP